MSEIVISAEQRDTKEKASHLRKTGWVPSVISSHGETTHIKVKEKDLQIIFAHGVSESLLFDIEYSGKKETAFIKDYQIHPAKDNILHVDFFRITYGEKIKTNIPFEFTGKPVGVKEGGVLELFLHDIEIETLPRYLKPKLEVDITGLNIGDALHLNDINIPEETKVLVEGNPIICQVSSPAKMTTESPQEEVEEVAEEEAVEE